MAPEPQRLGDTLLGHLGAGVPAPPSLALPVGLLPRPPSAARHPDKPVWEGVTGKAHLCALDPAPLPLIWALFVPQRVSPERAGCGGAEIRLLNPLKPGLGKAPFAQRPQSKYRNKNREMTSAQKRGLHSASVVSGWFLSPETSGASSVGVRGVDALQG